METQPAAALPLVLCVDDELSILKSLQRLLSSKAIQLLQASSAEQALVLLKQHRVHLIICDMRMPHMSGAEFLAQAAVLQPDCYRILLTGYADLASTVDAINLGRIHRYVQKPWQNADLLQQVDDGLEHFRLIQANKHLTATVARQLLDLKKLHNSLEEKVASRTSALKAALEKLQQLLNLQQQEHHETQQLLYNLLRTSQHIDADFAMNVAQTAGNLARQLNVEQPLRRQIRQAGMLCELGKLALPATLLQQPLYKLTPHDKTLYLQHPQYADDLLTPAQHLQPVRDIITAQYEKFAPTPDQPRSGPDIPLGARIIAVARDFWLYRTGQLSPQLLNSQQAYEVLHRQQGTVYDPVVLMALHTLINSTNMQDTPANQQGLSVAELRPGMKLRDNLFSKTKLILVPKGQQLTAQTIASLQRYQEKHQELLQVAVVLPEDLSEEEE